MYMKNTLERNLFWWSLYFKYYHHY